MTLIQNGFRYKCPACDHRERRHGNTGRKVCGKCKGPMVPDDSEPAPIDPVTIETNGCQTFTPLQFVGAWIECRHKGAKAIADRLGIDSHDLHCIASDFRRLGVMLPKMTRQRNRGKFLTGKIDVDELNRLIGERS